MTVPLRRIATVVNGGTPTADASNWGGEVPWATPVDLGRHDGRALGATERTLTDRGLETGSSLVPERSIILSTRAPIGYVCVNKVATSRPTRMSVRGSNTATASPTRSLRTRRPRRDEQVRHRALRTRLPESPRSRN